MRFASVFIVWIFEQFKISIIPLTITLWSTIRSDVTGSACRANWLAGGQSRATPCRKSGWKVLPQNLGYLANPILFAPRSIARITVVVLIS